MDPTDLWRQWYETGSRMWTDSLGGSGASFMDPWGLYRRWFEGMENMREQTVKSMASVGGGNGSEAAASAWQRGVDAAMENWRKSAETTTEMMSMTPRWMEMLDQARENLMAIEEYPKDPLEFAVQWYNATSGPYSEFVQDIIEREEFLEQGSRFLQNYASFYKIFKRQSEEYLHNIQVPTRSDITRVASLVVNLEEKVDRIEETVEDMDVPGDSGVISDRIAGIESRLDEISKSLDAPSDTSRTDGLSERMDRVEGKLDSLLAALENVSSNGEVSTEVPANAEEIKATDAARRKASDMGVNLAEVNGTGADGQITVEDVRKKGEA